MSMSQVIPMAFMSWNKLVDNYRPRSEEDDVLGSVRPSVCPSVSTLTVFRGSAWPSAVKSKEE